MFSTHKVCVSNHREFLCKCPWDHRHLIMWLLSYALNAPIGRARLENGQYLKTLIRILSIKVIPVKIFWSLSTQQVRLNHIAKGTLASWCILMSIHDNPISDDGSLKKSIPKNLHVHKWGLSRLACIQCWMY